MRALLLGLLLLASCGSPESAYDYGPTLSQTTRLATHNSYWVNHGVTSDLFSSGVGEQILDQLLVEHVRSIELDIHPDPATPHHFLVYHTAPGNGVCSDLASCLAPVTTMHDLVESHSAVIVILELKGITTPTFDADHSADDLDAELRLNLGTMLYTPGDLLTRCPSGASLVDCARERGWPYEAELAGKVLVAVLGNWNDFPGAVAPSDWAAYATSKAIRDRVAFPMGSSWQRDYTVLSEENRAMTDAKTWDAAWAQSAMLQVESFDDPLLKPAIAGNQIVRADGVFVGADREKATAVGVQLWQTDWPWDAARTDLAIVALPGANTASALLDADGGAHVPLPKAGETTTRSNLPPASGHGRLYVAAATGLAAGVTACVAASVGGQPDVEGVTWCKHKQVAAHVKPGKDPPADPNGERVTYFWQVCHASACSLQAFAPQGESFVLDVNCADGQCCAKPQWGGRYPAVVELTLSGSPSNGCFSATSLQQSVLMRWDPTVDHAHDGPVFVGHVQSGLP